MLANFFETKYYVGNFVQYHQILSRFSQLGPEAREYLLRGKIVGRLLDFFYDRASPFHETFRDMSDMRYLETQKPELGLPTSQEKK